MVNVKAFQRALRRARWGAHRGDEAAHPENTPAAFASALRGGARCIETDLRVTSDERVVLCHDPIHRGRAVEKSTARLLKLPGVEALGGREFRNILIGFEVKEPAIKFVPDRLALIVSRTLAKHRGPYFHLSFNFEILEAFARTSPQIPRVLLVSSSDPGTRTRRFKKHALDFIDSGGAHALCLSRKLLADWSRTPGLANLPRGAALLCYTLRTLRQVSHYYARYPIDLGFIASPLYKSYIP